MVLAMVIMFAVGYLLIACESVVRVTKTVTALLLGGALWALYAVMSDAPHIHGHLLFYLGETCEILVFLIGAMTIVEHIDRYGGFSFLVSGIHTRSKRKLMWILAFATFFMSALLDNMTTTIIMTAITIMMTTTVST